MPEDSLQQAEIIASVTDGPIRVNICTHRQHTIRIVSGKPVLLYEYPNISSSVVLRNDNSISTGFFQMLLEQSPLLKLNDIQKPTLINGKWVYVFKKAQQRISLVYEIKPTLKGQSQEFEYVSWKSDNIENNRKTFPRKSAKENLTGLNLDIDTEYYFLLSQIQLPLHRIDFYTQNPEQFGRRAVLKKIEKQQNSPALEINLVDFIEICFALSEEKNSAVAKFNEYFSSEDESTKRYLANMVTAIEANRPAIKKWLDFEAVIAYKNREELRTKRLLRAKENTTGRLKDWKLSEGYKLTRDDYNGTEKYEKEIIGIECKVTAEDEAQYLAEIGKDDTSWYHRLFFGDEPFSFHRELANFGAFDELPDLLGKYFIGRFLAMLPATAPTAHYTIETIIDIQLSIVREFEEVIKRTAIKIPELSIWDGGAWFIIDKKMKIPRIKYKLMAAVKSRAELDYIDYRTYDKAMTEWKSGIGKASVVCKSLLLVIETMNLIGAIWHSQHESDSEEKKFAFINVTASVADAITATEFIIGDKVEKIIEKTSLKNAAYKIFPGVNLISSVCYYMDELRNINRFSSNEQISLALAHSVVGLAATAGMASSALTLTGESAATAFGISATGWGLIAVALFLSGAMLVWVFTEEELEEWAKESEWCKDPKRRKNLSEQARNLHEIICKFRVECYLLRQIKQSYLTAQGTYNDYFNTITLQIRPGLLHQDKSRFKVTSLNIGNDNGIIFGKELVLGNKMLLLPDEKTQIDEGKDGNPGIILRRFEEADLQHVPDFMHDKLVYSCSVQLDLYGDGSDMYPAKPVEEKGTLLPRMRDNG